MKFKILNEDNSSLNASEDYDIYVIDNEYYYYDGTTVKEVTAGSITSNITDVLDHIYLSKQTRQINNCIVPETIELFDINVAGN